MKQLSFWQIERLVFLSNHGMISVGESIDKALAIAVEVVSLCEQYFYA
jgi:ribulose-5-phosphate 4-epimerase/fuculose-1-phosphate aldolase